MRNEKDRRLSALEKRRPKSVPVIVRLLVEPSPDGPLVTGAKRYGCDVVERMPGQSVEALVARAKE